MHDLSDEQFRLVKECLPRQRRSIRGGRHPTGRRAKLDGVLWHVRTSLPWTALPPEYPSASVCHRYYDELDSTGTLREVLERLEIDLFQRTGEPSEVLVTRLPIDAAERATGVWQTVCLLQSPGALAILSRNTGGSTRR